MHTLLEGSVQYELQILLLIYIKSEDFTSEELNYEIINFDFDYSEIGINLDPYMSPSSQVMRDRN